MHLNVARLTRRMPPRPARHALRSSARARVVSKAANSAYSANIRQINLPAHGSCCELQSHEQRNSRRRRINAPVRVRNDVPRRGGHGRDGRRERCRDWGRDVRARGHPAAQLAIQPAAAAVSLRVRDRQVRGASLRRHAASDGRHTPRDIRKHARRRHRDVRHVRRTFRHQALLRGLVLPALRI